MSGESKTEQREGDSRETERREVAMRSIILILAVMSLGLGSPTKVIFTLVIVLFVLSYPIKVILTYIRFFLFCLQTSDQKDIECIYIYKQLAFSHELLQNHKLQVFFLINPSTFIILWSIVFFINNKNPKRN